MIASIRGTTRIGSHAAHSAPTHDRHALSREPPECSNEVAAQAFSSEVMGHTRFGIRLAPTRTRFAEEKAHAVLVIAIMRTLY